MASATTVASERLFTFPVNYSYHPRIVVLRCIKTARVLPSSIADQPTHVPELFNKGLHNMQLLHFVSISYTNAAHMLVLGELWSFA